MPRDDDAIGRARAWTRGARRLAIAAVCVGVGLGLGCDDGCAGDDGSRARDAGGPAPPSELVFGTASEPDLLSPLFGETAAAQELTLLCQRELTVYDDRWDLVPDLAERVPSLDNGDVRVLEGGSLPDGTRRKKMVVTWRIRDDATWEDGVPVTADDFLFAWKVALDPRQEIIDRDTPERIEKMEVKGKDKKTLVVTWKEPYAFFADYRVHHALPAHRLSPRYRQADGTTLDLKKDPSSRDPLCNGPYALDEWRKGQYLRFVRNPHASPAPATDRVTVRLFARAEPLETALLAGELDGALPAGGLSVGRLRTLEETAPPGLSFVRVPGLVWAHIDFKLDDPWLSDVRVRRGIAMAIDREEILRELLGPGYTLANTYLPPRHWAYAPDIEAVRYDPAAAAVLLDEAGWTRADDDGIRKRGRTPLSLTLHGVAGYRDIERLQELVAAHLRRVGVEIRIDNRPLQVFFDELGRHRTFRHLSFYSWIMSPSSWGHTLWQSDMIPSRDNGWQGQNYAGWDNAAVTRWLASVPTELDIDKRRAILRQVQQAFADELPAIPMYFRPVAAVTRDTVRGFRPTGTQTPVTWNAHAWTLGPPAPAAADAPRRPTAPRPKPAPTPAPTKADDDDREAPKTTAPTAPGTKSFLDLPKPDRARIEQKAADKAERKAEARANRRKDRDAVRERALRKEAERQRRREQIEAAKKASEDDAP